jgi:hypothetical protein
MYQFVEGEYMKAEEYDLFLMDPSDFIIRYYLRVSMGYSLRWNNYHLSTACTWVLKD